MGNWGVGPLDNDVAVDVLDQFEALLARGASVPEATAEVIAHPPWDIEDMDDGCAIYLALLALQMQQHHVVPATKVKVIQLIQSGDAIALWEDAPPERQAERQKMLDDLIKALESSAL
jgi:hypothetical protein